MPRDQINIKLPPDGRERLQRAVAYLSAKLGIRATMTDVLLHGLALIEREATGGVAPALPPVPPTTPATGREGDTPATGASGEDRPATGQRRKRKGGA